VRVDLSKSSFSERRFRGDVFEGETFLRRKHFKCEPVLSASSFLSIDVFKCGSSS
jgi:hypothetical protein